MVWLRSIPHEGEWRGRTSTRIRLTPTPGLRRRRIMHGNRARLLTTAVAVVMIAAAALPWVSRSATVARAGHGWPASTGLHVWSIHHSWAPEDYCWESYTASLTAIQVRDKLNETINGVGWDGTGSGRIDNVPTTTSCDYTRTQEAGSTWFTLRRILFHAVTTGRTLPEIRV